MKIHTIFVDVSISLDYDVNVESIEEAERIVNECLGLLEDRIDNELDKQPQCTEYQVRVSKRFAKGL